MADYIGITIKFASALSRHTGNQKVIDFPLAGQDSLTSVLNSLFDLFPGLKPVVSPDGLDIADSINIYVNGDNVRDLQGLDTTLKHGATINIIPAVAAG